MKINHIAIYTTDLERLSEFYEEYFYAIKDKGKDYVNPTTGLKTRFLKFDNDVKLEIMTKPGLEEGEKGFPNTGFAHFCISAGSQKQVDSVTARLFKTGFHVVKPPRITGDGYYESCIEDPDGNLVEITE